MAAAPHHAGFRAVAPPGRIAKLPDCFITHWIRTIVQPTDTSNPDYFHRVVDCQWACPAHTDVPEYIRLIALGQFSDAYMVNRESNVFPGILGRVCDRPCEPACRRGRVEDKPVAICRLKRVAADHKDSIVDRLPVVPQQKNGKRVACIGAGPASLTVANDLLPLGYEVVIFEQWDKPGGLMRTNIPAFRLPETVIDEEIGYITGMGAEIRYNSRIESLKKLLATGGFDAVFVGSGAPKGKELDLPGPPAGRRQHPHRHRLARIGRVQAPREDRQPRADHRRRQHGDGLLPVVAAPRRDGREGDGPQAAPVLQGLGVGARGRRVGERRDRRQPRAEELRGRERPPHGHAVRPDGVRARRARPHRRRARRGRGSSSRPTT